ncbi:DUF1937 family protein [Pseudomonas knackmussii]|uniref:DUF1937 family protein n=1 Tax=Pseudomonas knackmussii TaxID=65741 RepID=UPI0013633C5B|nr:DUF1937 family protein [Pseudomonas knackmussii]
MHPIIYVAGPYRAPDRAAIARNIESAGRLGAYVCTLGWFPIIPHMNTAHLEVGLPALGDEFWLKGTMELMERCDAVALAPGWQRSAGTLAEIARAEEMRLPVFREADLIPSAKAFVAWLMALEARRA